MIAKAFRMCRSGTSSMRRLVEYITSEQGKAHRIGEIIISNCQYESPELAMWEMLITQARNHRATSDKTYHLLLSFRPGENPTPDTLRKVESAICRKLGFEEHQRIAVVHRDTDSVHLHIAINKIHPRKLTIHNPYRDWKDLGKECERLEKMLYLAADNHSPSVKTETERKARDIEALTGEQSLLTWIRQECLPALKMVDSWEAFHRELANAGLTIKLQNNGVNFVAASGERVKGSGVDRAFSKSALEKRFGAFQEMPAVIKDVTPQNRTSGIRWRLHRRRKPHSRKRRSGAKTGGRSASPPSGTSSNHKSPPLWRRSKTTACRRGARTPVALPRRSSTRPST